MERKHFNEKKALVIKGLRQIGKTYIVKQFADEYYENQIYINFKRNDDLKTVFDENLDVNRILMDLSAKMPEIRLMKFRNAQMLGHQSNILLKMEDMIWLQRVHY